MLRCLRLSVLDVTEHLCGGAPAPERGWLVGGAHPGGLARGWRLSEGGLCAPDRAHCLQPCERASLQESVALLARGLRVKGFRVGVGARSLELVLLAPITRGSAHGRSRAS